MSRAIPTDAKGGGTGPAGGVGTARESAAGPIPSRQVTVQTMLRPLIMRSRGRTTIHASARWMAVKIVTYVSRPGRPLNTIFCPGIKWSPPVWQRPRMHAVGYPGTLTRNVAGSGGPVLRAEFRASCTGSHTTTKPPMFCQHGCATDNAAARSAPAVARHAAARDAAAPRRSTDPIHTITFYLGRNRRATRRVWRTKAELGRLRLPTASGQIQRGHQN